MRPRNKPLTAHRTPSGSPEKPEILVAEATQRVLRLLREQDEIIGNLTDREVKWLLMYAYMQFGVRQATLAFDFHSAPKKISITPLLNGEPFKVRDWARAKFRLKWQKVERDLPRYLGLNQFRIEFCRVAPRAAYRLEGNRDEG